MIDLTLIAELPTVRHFKPIDGGVSFVHDNQLFSVVVEGLKDGAVLHLNRFDEVVARVVVGSQIPDIPKIFSDVFELLAEADKRFEGADRYVINVRYA